MDGFIDCAEILISGVARNEVVLSACSSGWRPYRVNATELAGDDILGLPGAFLEAGASTILVSIPLAEDAPTRRLNLEYHRRRKSGSLSDNRPSFCAAADACRGIPGMGMVRFRHLWLRIGDTNALMSNYSLHIGVNITDRSQYPEPFQELARASMTQGPSTQSPPTRTLSDDRCTMNRPVPQQSWTPSELLARTGTRRLTAPDLQRPWVAGTERNRHPGDRQKRRDLGPLRPPTLGQRACGWPGRSSKAAFVSFLFRIAATACTTIARRTAESVVPLPGSSAPFPVGALSRRMPD